MSFSSESTIRLSRKSLFVRFSRMCERFTNDGINRAHTDLCTLGRVFLLTVLKLLGVVWVSTCLLLFITLAVVGFISLTNAYGVMYAIGAFIAGAAILGAAIVAIFWTLFKIFDLCEWLASKPWRKADTRLVYEWTQPKPRTHNVFQVAGQRVYDQFHGICRKIEFV